MSPTASKKKDLSPTFEGTVAVPSEFLEFYGDHEYISYGLEKKKAVAMKFITFFFSQSDHSKVVYILKRVKI